MTIRRFIAVVMFVGIVLLLQQRNPDSEQVLTGIVTTADSKSVTVSNDTLDPGGLVLSLRDDLRAEGAYPAKIDAGAEVTVWYRRGADREPVALKIELIPARR